MQKFFITILLLTSLIVVSCKPKQNLESTQTTTLPPVATTKIIPSSTFIPSVTPTAISKSNTFYNMSVSPDGKMIAVLPSYGVQIYNLSNGDLLYSSSEETIGEFHEYSYQEYSYIAWSPDGEFVAVGRPSSVSSKVRVWNTASWDLLTENEDSTGVGYQLFGLDWTPDSNQLAVGRKDGSIQIWDSKMNAWISEGRCDTIRPFGLTWTTNNELRMFSNLGIYSTSTCNKIETTEFWLDGSGGYAVLSPDEKNIFLSTGIDGSVASVPKNIYMFKVCCLPIMAWSMDGRYFAVTPSEGNTITTFDTIDRSSAIFVAGKIQGLAWSLDNELLVLGQNEDGENVIWSTKTQKILVRLKS